MNRVDLIGINRSCSPTSINSCDINQLVLIFPNINLLEEGISDHTKDNRESYICNESKRLRTVSNKQFLESNYF